MKKKSLKTKLITGIISLAITSALTVSLAKKNKEKIINTLKKYL